MNDYTDRLIGDGYELYLYAAPPLAVSFLRRRWGVGMTAGAAARLLRENGYVAPASADDRYSGRVLGVHSTLRCRGELRWERDHSSLMKSNP